MGGTSIADIKMRKVAELPETVLVFAKNPQTLHVDAEKAGAFQLQRLGESCQLVFVGKDAEHLDSAVRKVFHKPLDPQSLRLLAHKRAVPDALDGPFRNEVGFHEIRKDKRQIKHDEPIPGMPFKPLIELARRPDFTFEPPERVNAAMWTMPGVERYKLESQVIWRFKRHGFYLNFTYFEDHQSQPHVRVMASRPCVHEGQYFIEGFEAPKGIDIREIQPGKHVQLVLDGNHRVVGGTENEERFEKKTTKKYTEMVLVKSQDVSATKSTVKEIENLLRRVGDVAIERKNVIFPEKPKPNYPYENLLTLLYRRFVKEKPDPGTQELIQKAKKHVIALLEHMQTNDLR